MMVDSVRGILFMISEVIALDILCKFKKQPNVNIWSEIQGIYNQFLQFTELLSGWWTRGGTVGKMIRQTSMNSLSIMYLAQEAFQKVSLLLLLPWHFICTLSIFHCLERGQHWQVALTHPRSSWQCCRGLKTCRLNGKSSAVAIAGSFAISAVPVAVLNSKGYECMKLQICKLSLQVLSKPAIMAILRAWLDRNPSGSSGEYDTEMFTAMQKGRSGTLLVLQTL